MCIWNDKNNFLADHFYRSIMDENNIYFQVGFGREEKCVPLRIWFSICYDFKDFDKVYHKDW